MNGSEKRRDEAQWGAREVFDFDQLKRRSVRKRVRTTAGFGQSSPMYSVLNFFFCVTKST